VLFGKLWVERGRESFEISPDQQSRIWVSYGVEFTLAQLQMAPCWKMADWIVLREKLVISPETFQTANGPFREFRKKNISRDTKQALQGKRVSLKWRNYPVRK